MGKTREKVMQALNTAINVAVLGRVGWSLFGDGARSVWRWLVGPVE